LEEGKEQQIDLRFTTRGKDHISTTPSGLMEIIIELDPKSYESLLSRVLESSSAHRPRKCHKLDSVGDAMFFEKYVIHCDEA
jgi:hypothetical protein